MADTSGSQNLLGSIINSAFQFATPFAQKLLGQSSTPSQLHTETLKAAALNGSGPNDPTLAGQSPQGLTDFLTGGRVTGSQTTGGQGGLFGGVNLTFVGIAVIAIVAVFVILKK